MQVSSGRAHMLVSNHRGRGQDPVTVLGNTRSFVMVNGIARRIILEVCRVRQPTICRREMGVEALL